MPMSAIAKFLNVSITKVHGIVKQIREGKEAPATKLPKPLKRKTFHATIMKQVAMGQIESGKRASELPTASTSYIQDQTNDPKYFTAEQEQYLLDPRTMQRWAHRSLEERL